MRKITLSDGFEMELSEDAMDNMELVDALTEMKNDNDTLAVSKITRLILGEENRRKLYDHIRLEDGRVPVKSLSKAVAEIIHAYGEKGKN